MTDTTLLKLQKNGFDFLSFGLRLILEPSVDEKDLRVAVANIQIGVELLIKYKIAKDKGLQEICTTDLSSLTNVQIEDMAELGTLKTFKFETCKHKFISNTSIGEYERNLIDRFQRLRNSIVHFGAVLPRELTIAECSHVVLKVVRRIIADDGSTHLADYLSQDVYKSLIKFPQYINEAVDDAHKFGEDVRLCFECKNETLTTVHDEFHYCFSCGFFVFEKHAPYIDCPYCKGHKTAVYDSLNSSDGIFRGKCISCDENLLVAKCAFCEVEVFPEVFAKYDEIENEWYCEECHEAKERETQS